jgi:4-hydroxy-2-oxoheptanedioate aldolase
MIGAFVQTPKRAIAQVLAASGIDLLIADGEHAPLSPADIEEIVVGGDLAGVPVLARVPFSPAAVQHALDSGAAGVLVPLVESAEAAKAAVAAARFPPRGRRGGGPGRAALYGLDRARALEREVTVAIQIETAAALEQLDSILSVDGIDMIFVGPNDLALSLGRSADAEIADVLTRARGAGFDTGTLAAHADAETTLTVVGTDLGLLAAGATAAASRARKRHGDHTAREDMPS